MESILSSLSEQVAALGKTADEAARLKLAAQGATDAELNKVRAMQDVIRQYEKQAGVMKTLEDLQREFERVAKPPPKSS